MTNRLIALLIGGALALWAPPAANAAAAAPAVSAELSAKLKAAVQRAVPAGMKPVHPVLVLDLGAGSAAAVELYAEDPEEGTFKGMTAVAGPDGRIRTASLPDVNTGAREAQAKPDAVFTTEDGAGKKALVMLWWYYTDGTGAPEWHGGSVYRWNGAAWTEDEARSSKLDNVKTAKAARLKLAR